MTNVRVIKPALAALVAAAACVGGLAFSSAQPAQADTYSDLINAQNQHAASVQREAELKQQLAGASQDLANKVLELDDLTNNKIVAAQAKVTQANEDAAAPDLRPGRAGTIHPVRNQFVGRIQTRNRNHAAWVPRTGRFVCRSFWRAHRR